MTITKQQYEDYLRLKDLERSGHVLGLDALRLIVREAEYDPAKVGRHFLELYAKWNAERRK